MIKIDQTGKVPFYANNSSARWRTLSFGFLRHREDFNKLLKLMISFRAFTHD